MQIKIAVKNVGIFKQRKQGIIGVSHRILTHVVPKDIETERTVQLCLKTRVKEIFTLDQYATGIDNNCGKFSPDDRKFLDIVYMGIHKLSTGHYKMPLSFKRKNTLFKNNEYQALIILNQLKRRLVKNNWYASQYSKYSWDKWFKEGTLKGYQYLMSIKTGWPSI